MTDSIQIICDDQQHSREKIAKIELFKLIEGSWQPQYHVPAEGRHHTLKCKLCRFNLPVRDENLQRALTLLADRGVSETTLRFIAVVSADRRLR